MKNKAVILLPLVLLLTSCKGIYKENNVNWDKLIREEMTPDDFFNKYSETTKPKFNDIVFTIKVKSKGIDHIKNESFSNDDNNFKYKKVALTRGEGPNNIKVISRNQKLKVTERITERVYGEEYDTFVIKDISKYSQEDAEKIESNSEQYFNKYVIDNIMYRYQQNSDSVKQFYKFYTSGEHYKIIYTLEQPTSSENQNKSKIEYIFDCSFTMTSYKEYNYSRTVYADNDLTINAESSKITEIKIKPKYIK